MTATILISQHKYHSKQQTWKPVKMRTTITTTTPALLWASLATAALANGLRPRKTDLTGCTSTDVSSPAGASVLWYVPGTGELCEFLDCGGGTAPPKTDVPGCPLYSGPATYSPSFLPGYGSATAAPASASMTSAAAATHAASSSSSSSSSVNWSAMETNTAVSSWDLYTNTMTSSAASSGPPVANSWTSVSSQGTSGPMTTSSSLGTTAAPVASTPANGTVVGAGNATRSSSSGIATQSINGAAEHGEARMAAGLIMGLAAVVLAL